MSSKSMANIFQVLQHYVNFMIMISAETRALPEAHKQAEPRPARDCPYSQGRPTTRPPRRANESAQPRSLCLGSGPAHRHSSRYRRPSCAALCRAGATAGGAATLERAARPRLSHSGAGGGAAGSREFAQALLGPCRTAAGGRLPRPGQPRPLPPRPRGGRRRHLRCAFASPRFGTVWRRKRASD